MAYSSFQLAQKYLHYFISASNSRGHGIHSPFVYDFVKNVLLDHTEYPEYQQVELYRKQLLADKTLVEVTDFGAGSAIGNTRYRTIREITAHAAKRKKFSQLLFRMARYYAPETCIELGTAVGITASYLAAVPDPVQN